MENDPIPLPSGATLEMQIASFKDSSKLMRTVADELTKVQLELKSVDLKDLAGQDVNSLKNAVFGLLASAALEQAIFDCTKGCTIDGVKVTRDSFESQETRGDYMLVAWEVIKMNLLPFIKSLPFLSKLSSPKEGSGQKLV